MDVEGDKTYFTFRNLNIHLFLQNFHSLLRNGILFLIKHPCLQKKRIHNFNAFPDP